MTQRYIKLTSIVLALFMLMQSVLLQLPVRPVALAASPADKSLHQSSQATSASDSSLTGLQRALDQAVSLSLTAGGWQVTALQSQLDNPSLQLSPIHGAGNGQWHATLQDEKQQQFTLEGPLTFEAETISDTGTSNLNISVKGKLTGPGSELTLDTNITDQKSDDGENMAAHFNLNPVRNGQASNLSIASAGSTQTLAYNLIRSSGHTSINRDGKQNEINKTTITRNFGKGESEIWIDVTTGTGNGVAPAPLLSQHLFRHNTGQLAYQFLDRFDLQVDGDRYSLQSPSSVIINNDNSAKYALTLVNAQGKTLKLSADATPHGLNRPLAKDILDSANASDNDPLAAYVVDPLAGSAPDNAPAAGGCGSAGQEAAFVIGAGLVAVVLLLAGLEFLPILALGGAVTAAEVNFLWGAFLFGTGALGGVTAGCNADPYFFYPDIRPQHDTSNGKPLQVIRVSGGLITSTAAFQSGTPAAGISAQAQTPASQSFYSYRERPDNFVGGNVPAGATPLGTWTWDTTRPYGATASHTEKATTGLLRHYFIHAGTPLQLGDDDNIIQYVYIDPQNPPGEIYLQFYTGDGDGEHRAYWGEDLVQTGGIAGQASLYPMGGLPDKGVWIRLKVPTLAVGLNGKAVNGILFGANGGQIWWGPTTTSNSATDNAPDRLPVDGPDSPPAVTLGAQFTYQLQNSASVTIEIKDQSGMVVRTLEQGQNQQPGYYAATWDGKDTSGTTLPDAPYTARFLADGKEVTTSTVSLSPLVASLSTPGPFTLVRGIDVPVIGEAYGTTFSKYVVEYGEGLQPATWKTIASSVAPAVIPRKRPLRNTNPGNLANWNTGLNEYGVFKDSGLSGVYTIRLRVTGKDGRETSDSAPVIVGRLAHTAAGGTITSPDGKASLIIPALAIEETFSLMALIPLAQLEPNGGWQQNLPGDKTLAGDVYEIFPADESFRKPVTLRLPYKPGSSPDKIGILLGDGTRDGWRYLGGTADPQQGTVSVTIADLGGKRALVAPFTGDQFGPPKPYRNPGPALHFDTNGASPLVTAAPQLAAFDDDFEAVAGEWQALDVFGTGLERATGASAGLAEGTSALKVTRLDGGVRQVQVRSTSYDAAKYPMISFDYRLQPGYAPNLLVKSNGIWWQFLLGKTGRATTTYFQTLRADPLVADDAWHHYQLDILAQLRYNQPGATNFQIDQIVLGQYEQPAYMQVQPVDSGAVGSSYYIDNFAALAPTAATKPTFNLAALPGITFSGYSYLIDRQNDSMPPATATQNANSLAVTLPDNAQDGLWYLHIRGVDASGNWSRSAHVPLLLDRHPPQLGVPDPPDQGAGSPDFIQIPILDTGSGVDPASLSIELNGHTYSMGSGLAYNPDTHTLTIAPLRLNPAPGFIANGQKVALSLQVAADYAGNKLAQPVSWSFSADRPKASGAAFRLLTINGGTLPAVSPDGSQVAFVSSRGVSTTTTAGGTQAQTANGKIWLIDTTDFEEKSGNARALTNTNAHETDPAWSPDGKLIAYVSNRSSRPQIWSSAADGSNARQITSVDGLVASPTWSPDGKTIIFVKDGNLWQVNADGSGLHGLTDYADQPLQAVRWQPGGQLLAVYFNLYEEKIELYNLATGELTPLTNGGKESYPAWLNDRTILYTAPAGPGQPDAVWQINLDGSAQAILDGSGQAGIADMQPGGANNGDILALVSTRNGTRNIWIRETLQIARFDADPATGAPSGEPVKLTYSLPADGAVTLEVPGGSAGTTPRLLLDKAHQAKGLQTVTWDGSGADGKPMPPGDYTVKLSVQIGSGDPLERFTTVRILDPAKNGSLQIETNQWANTPLKRIDDLHIRAYPSGSQLRPVAQADYTGQPLFKLPAGSYDLVAEIGPHRVEYTGVVVEAGKTNTQTIDLQLGGLDLTVLSSSGQAATGLVAITVYRSDDPTVTPVNTQYSAQSSFVLEPGQYNAKIEYKDIVKMVYGIDVKPAQITTRSTDLGTGTFKLNVIGYAGQPAGAGGRLAVQAYSPQDHQTSLSTSYNNPAEIVLAAGRYDFKIYYSVGEPGRSANTGGTLEYWINGVDLQAGQTLTRDYDLHLGEATINVLEAAGKPGDTQQLSFWIYRSDNLTDSVASALAVNTATVQIPAGKYVVVADYTYTDLRREGPVGQPFEVTEGQHTDYTVNLKLGRLHIEVDDASGTPVNKDYFTFIVTPSNNPYPSPSFETIGGVNPVDLMLHAGIPYDISITNSNGYKKLILTRQMVKEGETGTIKVNLDDFK